jgi:steroid 5-alpha reductase family enzyme
MLPPNLPILFAGLGVIVLAATGLWLLSVRLTNASIADVGWGPGILLCGLVYAALGSGWQPRTLLVLGLCAAWAVRLAVHIGGRNAGKGEDKRYQAFRAQYGPQRYWWVSFFQTFLLQGVLAWVCSLPLFVAITSTQPGFGWLGMAGAALVLAGGLFEAAGDAQLLRFKRDPANKGRVMQTGLWRYTRHPNYFGECVVWWGFWLVAAAAGGDWTILSPVLMTGLLTRVSGVAMTERFMADRPEYAAYVRRTSAFFPWPPRS